MEDDGNSIPTNEDIKHAPLISAGIIDSTDNHILPQVGFLGVCANTSSSGQKSLFLNTNVPFSALICGVQGSGKSHTVSCLLGQSELPLSHVQSLTRRYRECTDLFPTPRSPQAAPVCTGTPLWEIQLSIQDQ